MGSCLEGKACNETEADAESSLASYYQETCVYVSTADGQGGQNSASTGQGDQVVNAPSSSGSNLERLALGVGLASGFVALVAAVFAIVKCLHRNVSYTSLS
jgi:hypothetical protein